MRSPSPRLDLLTVGNNMSAKWTAKDVQRDNPWFKVDVGGILYSGTMTRSPGIVHVQELRKFFRFTLGEITKSLNSRKALDANGQK